jgi:predicted patatin/cPLA2 family phospholipase
MIYRTVTLSLSFVCAITLIACQQLPQRELSSSDVTYAMTASGADPLDTDRLASPMWGIDGSGMLATLERRNGRPLQILELSGGGAHGAFGAGFLAGWAETGAYPEFDIVTGVSTGALMSTFAFLGQPEDLRILEMFYTQITNKDIFEMRPILSIATGTHSLAITEPLKKSIEKMVTLEVLQRVAKQYDNGRRLYVATTNLDYNHTWVWDLGAIAKQGDDKALQLYRDVLLAASAVPLFFPPVEIKGHYFIDGAVRHNLLIVGLMGRSSEQIARLKTEHSHLSAIENHADVYIINNGRLFNKPKSVEPTLTDVTRRSLENLVNSSMADRLFYAYLVTRLHGYDFRYVEIPADYPMDDNALHFDQKEMSSLFDLGRRLGRMTAFSNTPPPSNEYPIWVRDALEKAISGTK